MPIYMDRHDIPGVTAKDVAHAHQEDLKIQKDYDCRGLTYWYDDIRGTAFCLIDAPDEHAVKEMHDNAHGLIPHQIIEVDSNVVNAFLGRIEDPKSSDLSEDSDFPVINESAYRTIMSTNLVEYPFMISKYGNTDAKMLLNTHDSIIQKAIEHHNGRKVNQSREGFIVSFSSMSNSILCVHEIQKEFKNHNDNASSIKLHIRIGLNAGSPVTGKEDLFGETVQLAKRCSEFVEKYDLIMSSEIRDLYKSNQFNILNNRDPINTKALSPGDEIFLNHLIDLTEKIWNEPGFNVAYFAKQLGLSKSQLYRKITSLTGYAPNDFIKEFRLKKAVKLIDRQTGNISEIALDSGFNSPSYFSSCFQKRFGILPSSYANALDQ